MSTSAELAKCSCSLCGGHLEFETVYAGERIACPHCRYETVLYIPARIPPLPPPLPAAVQAAPIADSLETPGDQSAPPARLMSSPISVSRPAPPRETGSFAPHAARLSWVLFFVALVVSFLLGKANPNMERVLLNATLLLMLVGAGLGGIALLGIRRYRIGSILIPALIGILLNGGFLLALHRARDKVRRHHQEVSRKAAASILDVARHSADDSPITNILRTGDARADAMIRISAELINKGYALRESMDAEIKALGEREIFSVLGNKSAIKAEIDKRVAAQKIIERHLQELPAFIDSQRQKMRALKLPKNRGRRGSTDLDSGRIFYPNTNVCYSLPLRMKQAECELLHFLWSQFGHYRVVNRQVLFTSEAKLQEFNRLTSNIDSVLRERQELERQQEATRQALRTLAEQGIR